MDPTRGYRYSLLYTRSVRVAVVLANLKDNIDKCRFEARHMLKVLKTSVVIENLILFLTHIRKFSVYASLRLWCKCLLVEFYVDSCWADRCLKFFWYPIPAQNLYFHVRSSPTLNYCYYFYRRLLDEVSWCIHFLHKFWWRHRSSGSLCECSTNHSNRMKTLLLNILV